MEARSNHALALFFELYESLPRQGPGNGAATERALALLPDLPLRPRIADLGCGGGASTRVLAAATGGTVAAVDIHLPFLAGLLPRERNAGAIHPIAADMARPPLAPGSFDLVWSEGAIYQIGFAQGLQRWRRLLKPGGCLAVTEATWLSDAPPAGARRFWAMAYPAMTTIAANEASVAAAGYRVVGSFVLPPECWLDSYYAPLERALAPFAARHPGDPAAAMIAAEIRTEIDMYRRYGDSYGYVFYLAQAA